MKRGCPEKSANKKKVPMIIFNAIKNLCFLLI